MKQQKKRAIPLPEAIDGQRWQIQQSPTLRTAGINPSGQMLVPLDPGERERMVRMHEMTHVKITPGDEMDRACAELDDGIVNLCEDARVHGQMQRLRFPVEHLRHVIPDHEMKHAGEKAHYAELAGLAAAMYGTGELNRLLEAIPPGDIERRKVFHFGMELAERRMSPYFSPELPGFDVTRKMAEDILALFGRPDEQKDDEDIPWEHLDNFAPPAPLEYEEDCWGEMSIEEPPLPIVLPGKLRKGRRKKVADLRGRRLHRVGRLCSDGRVFAHRPPLKGGGAVVIDTSGSMSLEPEEVLALCIHYPAGVIAAYSGWDDADGNSKGVLRVIARNGRRVRDDQIDPPGGGNEVDGPALDWLAKQPGPRYWISDAHVTGGDWGLRYCLDVCVRNNIKRVDNAWEIVGKV